MFAAFKAGLVAGQHELPLRRRRARLPVGQRRRRRRRVPRLVRRADRADPRPRCPRSARWLWVDDGSGPCPDWAVPYEDAAGAAHRRHVVGAVGPRRRRPPAALHRRHHRHAQGRDVAPGRPVRRARSPTANAHAARAGPRRGRASRITKPGPAQPAGRAADARHRAVHRDLQRCSVGGGVVTLESAATSTPSELLDTDRARHGVNSIVDRRRRVRQADPARPRRRARTAGTSRALRVDHLVGRDVERGDQGRACSRHNPRHDPGRLARLVARRSAWRSRSPPSARRRATTAKFTLGAERPGHHRRRPRRRAGLGRASAGSRVRGCTPLGYYKDEAKSAADVPHHRRRALLDPRRLRHGRGRRHGAPARPRQPVHQHRRREGLPRRGRGGRSSRTRRSPTPSSSACPTSVRRGDHRASSSRTPGDDVDEAALIAHVKSHLAAYKAPKRVVADRHDRPRPPTARSTTSVWHPRPPPAPTPNIEAVNPGVENNDAVSITTFAWSDYDGVLFDLDGVITPTAEIHERAWAELFAAYDYTGDDYLRYIDGKPRYDGVRSFLLSRGITLPDGTPDDPPGTDTVSALGNRKNTLFNEILDHEGIAPFPGSAATLDVLEQLGVPAAIVSSSKNARPVLEAAGLSARFDVVVDGIEVAARGLPGKPAPDAYLLGAEMLGVDASKAIVVEDAVSGVAAGAAGHFAVVIGVDRGAGHDTLLSHGADIVVDDLSELLPDACRQIQCRRIRCRQILGRSSHREPPFRPDRAPRVPLPDRAVAARRARVPQRRPRPDRDALRPRQWLPRDAGEPGGGPRGAQPRHVPQRIPRDVAHPARRGRLRVRQDGPDHGQRARRQGDEVVRRRRAAAAHRRRPRRIRAQRRLPHRHPRTEPRVADPGRQACARPVHADGQHGAPPPGRDDVRDHVARRGRARRRVVTAHQPPGRRGRVPRQVGRARRGDGPAQGPQIHRPGAPSAAAARTRERDHPRLPLQPLRHDARLRHPPLDRHGMRRRGQHAGLTRPDQDRVQRARHRGRADPDHETRRVPLLHRRARRGTRRPLHALARPRRDRRLRRTPRRAASVLRRLLGGDRHRVARRRQGAAGDPLEPLPAGQASAQTHEQGIAAKGVTGGRLRRPLLLGHGDVRRAVPRLHRPGGGAQAAALPLGDARRRRTAGGRDEPGRRAVPVADDQRRGGVGVLRRGHRAVPHQRRRSRSRSTATSRPPATSSSSPTRAPRCSSRRRGCGPTSGFYGTQRLDTAFHIHRVTGPDEYTTVVNDNLYTNVMARFNLRYAARTVVAFLAEWNPDAFDGWSGATPVSTPTSSTTGTRPPTRCSSRTTRSSASTPRTTTFLDLEPWDWEGTPADEVPAAAPLPPARDLPPPGAQAGRRRAGHRSCAREQFSARAEAAQLRLLRPDHHRRLVAVGVRAVDRRRPRSATTRWRSTTSTSRSTSTSPTPTATPPTACTSPMRAVCGPASCTGSPAWSSTATTSSSRHACRNRGTASRSISAATVRRCGSTSTTSAASSPSSTASACRSVTAAIDSSSRRTRRT